MKNVGNCSQIPFKGNESNDVTKMKRLLCKIGKYFQFDVDVEEQPESELGKLIMRHDIIWYKKKTIWYKKLIDVAHDSAITEEYKKRLKSKQNISRIIQVAFEIEGADCLTKSMKGCISNLSKYPFGVIVVKQKNDRKRFERVLIEFEKLHGPTNVIIVSFNEISTFAKILNILNEDRARAPILLSCTRPLLISSSHITKKSGRIV